MRKFRTIVLSILTVLTLGLSAGPAFAGVHPNVAGAPDCLASGSTCLRDANDSNSTGNPIVEGSNINGTAENLTWDASTQTLQFNGHPTLCVGLDSGDSDAVTQACNGGHGIIWIRSVKNGAFRYLSNAATQHFGTTELLTAVNMNGFQIGVAADGQGFQRWTR